MTVSDQSGTLVSVMESVCRKMEANDELEEGDRIGECDQPEAIDAMTSDSSSNIGGKGGKSDKGGKGGKGSKGGKGGKGWRHTAAQMMFRNSLHGAFDRQRRECSNSWKQKKVCDRECTLILLGPSDSLEGCSQHKPHASCMAEAYLPGFGRHCDRKKVMNQCAGEYCTDNLHCQSHKCDIVNKLCKHCGPRDPYCLKARMDTANTGLTRSSALKLWVQTWKHELQGKLGRDTFRDSAFFKVFSANWLERFKVPKTWASAHEQFGNPQSFDDNSRQFVTSVVGGDGWIQLGGGSGDGHGTMWRIGTFGFEGRNAKSTDHFAISKCGPSAGDKSTVMRITATGSGVVRHGFGTDHHLCDADIAPGGPDDSLPLNIKYAGGVIEFRNKWRMGITDGRLIISHNDDGGKNNLVWETTHGENDKAKELPAGFKGCERWDFEIKGKMVERPALSPDGATVFVGSDENRLYAINAVDGAKRWHVQTGGQVNTPTISPDGTTAFVGSHDGRLHAINIADGTKKWEFVVGTQHKHWATWVLGSTISPDGTAVFCVASDNTVYAINAANGKKKWDFYAGHLLASDLTVSPDGATLFIASRAKKLHAINTVDGTKKWEFVTGDETRGELNRPIVSPDGATVFFGSDVNYFYAVNTVDGTKKWNYRMRQNRVMSGVISPDGATVFFSTIQYLVAANAADGTTRWQFTNPKLGYGATPRSQLTSPTLSPDGTTVFVGNSDGDVYAFNAADHAKKWEYRPDKLGNPVVVTKYTGRGMRYEFSVNEPPIVSPDGATVFASNSGSKLYALVAGLPFTCAPINSPTALKETNEANLLDHGNMLHDPQVTAQWSLFSTDHQAKSKQQGAVARLGHSDIEFAKGNPHDMSTAMSCSWRLVIVPSEAQDFSIPRARGDPRSDSLAVVSYCPGRIRVERIYYSPQANQLTAPLKPGGFRGEIKPMLPDAYSKQDQGKPAWIRNWTGRHQLWKFLRRKLFTPHQIQDALNRKTASARIQPACHLACVPKAKFNPHFKLVGDSTAMSGFIRSSDSGETICKVTKKFVDMAKTCNPDNCCGNGECTHTCCNRGMDGKLTPCGGTNCLSSGDDTHVCLSRDCGSSSSNEPSFLRRRRRLLAGTFAKQADETNFVFENVILHGTSNKVLQREMIARIKSAMVEAPIDCSKGWCGPPERSPEFTINLGHDQSKVYDPVAICEMGWRTASGGGGSRGSRFSYFQVEHSSDPEKQASHVKRACCRLFHEVLVGHDGVSGKVPGLSLDQLPQGCKQYLHKDEEDGSLLLQVNEGVSTRSASSFQVALTTAVKDHRARAYRSSSMAGGGS